MKKTSVLLTLTLILAGAVAQADIVSSEDLVVLNAPLNDPLSFVSYSHDMTNPSSGPAFDPLTDTALNAELYIQFHDDGSLQFLFTAETVSIFQDGNLTHTRVIPEILELEIPYFGYETEEFSVNLSYLQDDGVLDVTLVALAPDFCVQWSKLQMDFERPAVPEPATLVLVGIGGLAVAARRRRIG